MANVVQGTSNGEYDLARSLRLYDTGGDLPERARELWQLDFRRRQGNGARILAPLRQIARSSATSSTHRKIDQLADTHRALHHRQVRAGSIIREWTQQAQRHVDKALGAGLTLSTLLVGINAETEAAYAAIRRQVCERRQTGSALPAPCPKSRRSRSTASSITRITITRKESEQAQSRQAGSFNSRVMGVVQDCTRESDELRTQAVQTSTRGPRDAGQDQRSCGGGRAVGGGDARGGADRGGPHSRHRGCPDRSRGCRRRCDQGRRPGRQGGRGQPCPVEPCRGDRIDPRPHPRHRRTDQPAGPERDHRGRPRRRCRPRLRGRRPGSEEPRRPDRPGDRRHHQQDHRHPAGDQADGRGQWLDQRHGRRGPDLRRPHPRRRWSSRPRR